MKNYVLLLLLFTGMVKAQIVNIPDGNFKAKLLAADVTNNIASTSTSATIPTTFNKIDVNGDGEIQQSEAAAVTLLDVSFSNIADLTGIEEFVSLHKLKCDNNQLTTLNIDSMSILVWLDCRNNNLTALNVTDKTFLQLLFCGSNQLSNLTLSNLPSLANLYCENNQLASLNLNGLTQLALFGCWDNQLSSLDFTGLNHLQSVNCVNNLPLTGINLAGHSTLTDFTMGSNDILNPSVNFGTVDLSGTGITIPSISSSIINTLNLANCTQLTTLNLFLNQISNINLTGCAAAQDLDLRCQLTALDISDLVNLQTLNISGTNTIPSIDFSHNINLFALDCAEYNPETLDLSANINLNQVRCTSNNLKYLFIKNGSYEEEGNLEWTLTSCPNLLYVCIDESQLSFVNSLSLFPATVVGSYCSFVPGGNYNTISGNVKYDFNDDGCDGGDPFTPHLRVNISDGTNNGTGFTSLNGDYTLYTQAGSFTVSPAIEEPSWFTVTPATVTIPFAENNNQTVVQDFCVAFNGQHPDLECVVSPVVWARPGFDAKYKITYRNKGNAVMPTAPLGIILYYDPAKLDYVSSSQPLTATGGNSINFGYATLLPFEARTIDVTFHVHSPTDVNPVNIGDGLIFTSGIGPVNNDETMADNNFTLQQTVVGAFDPNDITCLEGPVVATSEIGNYLHYAINFENMGTFEAENVVVKTIIDTAKFDISSLQLLSASHLVDARITGNKVEFIFKNIGLPIGGHGHILLKIKTLSNLVAGDQVAKRADIFFDYNFPVATNTATSVFQLLKTEGFATDQTVKIYPNPATDLIKIESDSAIKNIQLFDMQGRIIEAQLVGETQSVIEISKYAPGVYFVKVTTEKGMKSEKIIRE